MAKHASLAASAAIGLMLAGMAAPAMASGYWPNGPQQRVPVAMVQGGGWTVCYSAPIGTPFGTDAAVTLAGCNGSQLMLAGHRRGADYYSVLAAAPKSAALTDTGADSSNTHMVNGSEWYYAKLWAFGFAPAGQTVDLSSCDVTEGDRRMCVHTFSAVGGFRIGENMNLNSSSDWEVVVLTSSTAGQ